MYSASVALFLFCLHYIWTIAPFLGTSEEAIIDIIANRTVSQRQEIAHAYKAQFGEVNT